MYIAPHIREREDDGETVAFGQEGCHFVLE